MGWSGSRTKVCAESGCRMRVVPTALYITCRGQIKMSDSSSAAHHVSFLNLKLLLIELTYQVAAMSQQDAPCCLTEWVHAAQCSSAAAEFRGSMLSKAWSCFPRLSPCVWMTEYAITASL